MARSRRGRGRIVARGFGTCLVATVSALAICGNASWSAPPRFDGAGYAVLARALLDGQGYRAIDHPDRPSHVHFPPGYPLFLALTWSLTGTSAVAAHVASALCTVAATVLAWWWFRRILPGPTALLLGLALAVNWAWARTGAAIQSEPLYLLLSQASILVAFEMGRRTATKARDAVVLGLLLAACLLTRHIAIGLALAIGLDLVLRRRWQTALIVAGVTSILVAPWVGWLATLGPTDRTQAGLLVQGAEPFAHRIARQLVFYVQRIPDQITGPFVEIATVFHRSPIVSFAANVWAVAVTQVLLIGWSCALLRPRRRLAGLVPLLTLGILLVWPYTEAGRFLIPLIPFILLGAVEGLAAMARWIGRMSGIGSRYRPSRARFAAAGLVLALSLPYSAYMLVAGRARAMEATHHDFDAACDWIAEHGVRPGPILTRHPGEVFWRTGRQALEVPSAERPGDVDADVAAIARIIEVYRVAYLLVDRERYARATPSPLAKFVAEHPERVREVWSHATDGASVAIYEVEPDR